MTDDWTQLLQFVTEQGERPPVTPRSELSCNWCGRPMRLRFDGPCIYVMELEPGSFKRCGWLRGKMGKGNKPHAPTDPHSWAGGYDHVRDDRDPLVCKCDHGYHEGGCPTCAESHLTWDHSSHPYEAGTIELDHEARK